MSDESVTKHDWKYTRSLRNNDSAPGGLVIQDVYHQQYLLAKDIRVTRIWVGSLFATKQPIFRDYKLGSSALPWKNSTGSSNLPSEQGLIKPFRTPLYDSASYETAGPVLGADTKSEKLVVQQDYLFSDYGKDPPHEPAGLIDAARIYPLLSFSYPASRPEARKVDYIRVDYRLALTIEQFLDDTTNVKKGTEFQDQIGVFRDSETKSPKKSSQLFDTVEKPMKWEMLGEGLNWGRKSQWDNIHQWAADKLPPTPGAPHAAHLHWRWGFANTEVNILMRGVGRTTRGSDDQFAGPQGGGVLLDPRIPQQRLRFAITAFTPLPGGGPKAWAADENGSTLKFEELFISARGSTPLPIDQGTGLVIWLSVEARRKPTNDPWQGAFFAHGMFFAHEILKFPLSLVGTEAALYMGSGDTQQWWRPKKPDDT